MRLVRFVTSFFAAVSTEKRILKQTWPAAESTMQTYTSSYRQGLTKGNSLNLVNFNFKRR